MSDADNPNPVSAVRPRRQPDSRDMTLTSRDDHTNYHDDLLNNGFPDRAQGCQGSSRLEGSVLLVRTLCSLQSIYVSTRILNFVFTFPGRRGWDPGLQTTHPTQCLPQRQVISPLGVREREARIREVSVGLQCCMVRTNC